MVHRGKPPIGNGGDLAGNMPVVFHHGQTGVPQILLQEQKVYLIYQEMSGVGVPKSPRPC